MSAGSASLQLSGTPSRLLRLALGAAFLVALFLFLGSSGAYASDEAPSDSNQSAQKGKALLSGILNPVTGLVDKTLAQVPVVGDITGGGTVGKVLAPVTTLTDELEGTAYSVPILETVMSPVRDVTTAVVPPTLTHVSGVTTPVLDIVGQVTAPVVQVVAPVVDPVTGTLNPIVGGVTDQVAGTVDHVVDTVLKPVLDTVVTPVVDNVVTPILPVIPAEPVIPEVPTTPLLPGNPEPEAPSGLPSPVVPEGSKPADVHAPLAPGSITSPGSDQNIDAQPRDPAASNKEFPGRYPANISRTADTQKLAAPAQPDALSRYMTAAASSDSSPGLRPRITSSSLIPAGSPVAVRCSSDSGDLAVGPCAPALAVGPTPASASNMVSGASGGTAGSAAACENPSGQFRLDGQGVASTSVDWSLPASMPSNPGSTPG